MAYQPMHQKQIPTPDFETYSMDQPLVAAVVEDGFVRVHWSDGQEGRFHFMWLRDNCACHTCIDSGSHERIYNIMDIPADVHPRTVSISDQGGCALGGRTASMRATIIQAGCATLTIPAAAVRSNRGKWKCGTGHWSKICPCSRSSPF